MLLLRLRPVLRVLLFLLLVTVVWKLIGALNNNHLKEFSKVSHKINFTPLYDPTLNLYTINGLPIVWVFWDYTSIPVHIQLSLETFRCHSHSIAHVMLVDDKFLKSTVEGILPSFDWLSPNHKADFFRIAILSKFGGIYLDADTIQLRSVDHLINHLHKFDMFGYSDVANQSVIGVGLMGPMRADLQFLTQWRKDVDQMLINSYWRLYFYSIFGIFYPLEWGAVNAHWNTNLKFAVERNDLKITSVFVNNTFAQLFHYDYFFVPNLFTPMTETVRVQARKLNLDVEYLMYFNSQLAKHLRQSSIDQLIATNSLFVHLIRVSICNCKAYQHGEYSSAHLDKLIHNCTAIEEI